MTDENSEAVLKKLDLIIMILLAREGYSQREIAKILSISTKKIWEHFGDTFSKMQGGKS